MAKITEKPPTENIPHKEEEEDKEKSFEELGLDPRLIRALTKRGIQNPTPIQQVAIPLILEGKDVVARAKTGSGKTFAYLLPLLHKLFTDVGSEKKVAPAALILVPTRELSQQVYTEVVSLIELCRVQLKVVQLTSNMPVSDLRVAMAGQPDILVCTPACIPKCLSANVILPSSISDSLRVLVLDEADLLLSYGYEEDLKSLTAIKPRGCQCLLMSATSSDDIGKLKKLILHNPYILTLPEVQESKDDLIPKNVQQYWISCSAQDKLLNVLSLLKLKLVHTKVLIFANTIDMGFRLKLFLEKFGIKCAVMNPELPQNSRLHILEEFNAGLFDYLIAIDDSETKEKGNAKESQVESKKFKKRKKPKLDSEFGVARGIDFKNVQTVINLEMPKSASGYVHRIGRTGRAYSSGASISLVSANEMKVFTEIRSFLGDDQNVDSRIITPFTSLTKNAVESLRYRGEDIVKSVTKVAVREARAQDLKNEILNSEKLKAHFQVNQRDLDLLKHDKVLSKQPIARHLRNLPDYLLDHKTQEAMKEVKFASAAMGKGNTSHRRGFKRNYRKNGDPLKTFSSEPPRKTNKRTREKH